MIIRYKNDYQKYNIRSNVHTTIRFDLYDKWTSLSKSLKQPCTKMLDVALLQIFENEESIEKFIKKLREY